MTRKRHGPIIGSDWSQKPCSLIACSVPVLLNMSIYQFIMTFSDLSQPIRAKCGALGRGQGKGQGQGMRKRTRTMTRTTTTTTTMMTAAAAPTMTMTTTMRETTAHQAPSPLRLFLVLLLLLLPPAEARWKVLSPKPKTQNSKLKTQNPKPKTLNLLKLLHPNVRTVTTVAKSASVTIS